MPDTAMASPPGERHGWWSAAAVAAVSVTLVVAPQRHHLGQCSEHVALAGLLAANLVVAAGLALLGTWWWRRARQQLPRWLPLLSLPLLLLWLPRFAATGGLSARAHLLVLWPTLGVAAAVLAARRPRPEWFRSLGPAAIVAAVAAVGSWCLVGVRPGGLAGFACSILWGAYLVVAMAGWGRLVNRLVLPAQRLDWGLRAALGMAALVVAGGVLNLTWSISTGVVLLVLALGAGGLVAGKAWRRPELGRLLRRPGLVAVAVLLLAPVALQFAGSVAGTVDTVYHHPPFDLHDDEQAYLVFPAKMLQIGSMGAEPFEGRRMLSLGGQSFLQSLVLVARPVRALHLMDAGIGIVLLLGLVLGAGRRHGLDWRLTAFVLLLTLSLPHLEMRGNSSSVLTGGVLLLAWFRLLLDGLLPASGRRSAALVALCAAALCAVKSTFIPVAVVFLAVSTGCHLLVAPRRRPVVREALWTVLLIAFAVLPWMTSILESSGTLLYPVLGKGFYGGVFTNDFATIRGDFSTPFLQQLQVMGQHLVRFWPLLVLVVLVRDRRPRFPVAALTVAALSHAVLAVVLGDPSLKRGLSRYAFTILAPALLALVLAGLRAHRGRGLAAAAAPPVVAALVVGTFWFADHRDEARSMYSRMLGNAAQAMTGADFVEPWQRDAIATLEQAVPPGQRLLATLQTPYLLHFGRQPTLIMSLPAMASLPPGIPVDDGPEAVAGYLLGHSVRYLAYGGMADQRDLLDLTEENIRSRYPRLRMRWIMLRYHERYRRVVLELARSRKVLYRDRQRVLLDLGSRVRTVIPRLEGSGLGGFRDGVWTGANAAVDLGDDGPEASFLVLRTMGWHPRGRDAERIGLRVLADGRELELVETLDDGFLFRVEPRRRVRRVRVLSTPVDPATVGARAGGPPLGIDVRSLELADTVAAMAAEIRTLWQPVEGPLDPATVWSRSGFFRDFYWTDGDAALSGLSWPVPRSHRDLVLRLHRVHPCGDSPEGLGARVWVNGVELALVASGERWLRFRLYDGLHEINEVRLVSSTFVPAEAGSGSDRRRLGMPVESLETAQP